jgi:hypothetical protein
MSCLALINPHALLLFEEGLGSEYDSLNVIRDLDAAGVRIVRPTAQP